MTGQLSEDFYDGATARIRRSMIVLSLLTCLVLAIFLNWQSAAGFVIGTLLSFFNLHTLARGTSALVNRIALAGEQVSGGRIAALLVLRYVVIAAVAYGILSVSRAAFFGLVGGLFLPIAGVGCEAMYELYVALRRDF